MVSCRAVPAQHTLSVQMNADIQNIGPHGKGEEPGLEILRMA